MNHSALAELMAGTPFFEDMDRRYIDMFADCATSASWDAGHYILLEGKPAHCFHIVLDGMVLIEAAGGNRGAIGIQSLTAGDVLGWSWMQPPYVWHFDALATEDTQTIVVDALCIRGKCEADLALECELYKRFTALMTRRLLATRLQLMDIYS